jgi:hypothetical protein
MGDIPSSGDSEEGLPEFARSAWVSRFLPTLYAFLGSLERPWELSEQGSDDVKEIQKLINVVYPGSGYKVTLNDRIYSMVIVAFRITIYHSYITCVHLQTKGRINERRTYFGRQAIKIVETFLRSRDFADNYGHISVAEYALWATRPNGPGIWEIPTPINCTVKETSPHYIVCPFFM